MKRRTFWAGAAAWLGAAAAAASAHAGMPTPALTEWAALGVSALSFFIVVLLLSACLVQWLWNSLAKDFAQLPRLSYGRSLSVVVLWGFLFAFVLTMIAGARELLTPGAWELKGLTYKLSDSPTAPAAGAPASSPDAASLERRRAGMERLKLALWDYALKHDGRFPESLNDPESDASELDVPGFPGLAYVGAPGRTAKDAAERPRLLAFEPDAVGSTRLGLLTDGTILVLTDEQIRRRLDQEDSP